MIAGDTIDQACVT